MWDTVRKIFSHDAEPEDMPPSDDQTMPAPAEAPTRAGSDRRESRQDTTANAAEVSGPDAVEVSLPGHAPKGLAAEREAHRAAPPSAAREEAAATRSPEEARHSQGFPAASPAAVTPPAAIEAPPPQAPHPA